MPAQVFAPTSLIGKRVLRAAALSAQIDRLQAEYGEEKAYLLDYATKKGYDGLKSGGFTFSRRTKVSYIFSAAVQALAKRLKTMQEKEKENGKAIRKEGAEHLVLTVSVSAVADDLAKATELAALEALAQRTPSHSGVIRGTDFIPRTLEEAELGQEAAMAVQH